MHKQQTYVNEKIAFYQKFPEEFKKTNLYIFLNTSITTFKRKGCISNYVKKKTKKLCIFFF